MHNKAKAKIRGPLIITQDQVRKLFELVDDIRTQSPNANAYFQSGFATADVHLTDEQQFSLNSVDDIFKVPNSRSSRISRIVLRWPFGERNISISIGSEWFRQNAAEIDTSGDLEGNQSVIRTFNEVLDTDSDLFLNVLGWPRIIQAMVLTVFLQVILITYLDNAVRDIVRFFTEMDGPRIYGYLVLFWIIPLVVFGGLMSIVVDKFIGKAVFLWDGAQNRYNNRRLILTYAFWTLPIALLTKLIIG